VADTMIEAVQGLDHDVGHLVAMTTGQTHDSIKSLREGRIF
jgi:hypothetical protein